MVVMDLKKWRTRREDKLDESTLRKQEQILRWFDSFIGDREITEELIHEWVDKLKTEGIKLSSGPVSPSSIQIYLSYIESYLSVCEPEKEGVTRRVSQERFKTPSNRCEDWFSPEEVRLILAGEPDLKFRTIYSLCYAYARRIGEVLALKRRHVDFDSGTIEFKILKKKEETRVAKELEDPAETCLKEWIAEGSFSDSDKLFDTNRHSVNYRLRRICKELGIEHRTISSQMLRHSRVTHLLERGVPFKVIQENVCHHARMDTTLTLYGHSTPAMREKMIPATDILGEVSTSEKRSEEGEEERRWEVEV